MAAFLTKKSWYGTVKAFLGPYHHDLKSNKTIEQGESAVEVEITNWGIIVN